MYVGKPQRQPTSVADGTSPSQPHLPAVGRWKITPRKHTARHNGRHVPRIGSVAKRPI
jgi:hypothetical protein